MPKKNIGSLQGSSLVQMDQFVSIARGHQRCAIGLWPNEQMPQILNLQIVHFNHPE